MLAMVVLGLSVVPVSAQSPGDVEALVAAMNQAYSKPVMCAMRLEGIRNNASELIPPNTKGDRAAIAKAAADRLWATCPR